MGDVVNDQDGAGSPSPDQQRRIRTDDRNRRAILAEEQVLVPDERLAGCVDPAERTLGRRIGTAVRVSVVNNVVQLAPGQLLPRPAEDPLCGTVHEGDVLLIVRDKDGVRRAVGDRGEQA